MSRALFVVGLGQAAVALEVGGIDLVVEVVSDVGVLLHGHALFRQFEDAGFACVVAGCDGAELGL